jgi:ubiquitin-small subunit ribosomal protein S27Ae
MAEKAPVKRKKSFNRYKMYSAQGTTLERKNKACPKCGKDSYMANHKDRLTCGKCNYVEFIAKKK